eukprot:TRINITY_DN2376_c0_g1_i2.p1 TRINITY_DN2376_c0_g1~~TRINITY_DN2376_c0_g1_i2.p1  ORF type:complete len:182 (+),score=60.63 TRINITY_DN2376_c0_g1_i2:55-546(+)
MEALEVVCQQKKDTEREKEAMALQLALLAESEQRWKTEAAALRSQKEEWVEKVSADELLRRVESTGGATAGEGLEEEEAAGETESLRLRVAELEKGKADVEQELDGLKAAVALHMEARGKLLQELSEHKGNNGRLEMQLKGAMDRMSVIRTEFEEVRQGKGRV